MLFLHFIYFIHLFKRTVVTVWLSEGFFVCCIISLWRDQILLSLFLQKSNRWASYTVRSYFWVVHIPLSIDWSSVCSMMLRPGLPFFPRLLHKLFNTAGISQQLLEKLISFNVPFTLLSNPHSSFLRFKIRHLNSRSLANQLLNQQNLISKHSDLPLAHCD